MAESGKMDMAMKMPGNRQMRLYFTPVQLAQALQDAGKIIEIIAMDACSMSMVEFAYELKGRAGFMISSQEEVPDFSFPYSTLLKRFESQDAPIRELCKKSVDAYVNSYHDYIFNSDTDTAAVTLSALDLATINTITNPLRELASVLGLSAVDPSVADAIYSARQQAQGFVGGVFVDLRDFCEKLENVSGIPAELARACHRVSGAINDPEDAAGCIVANRGKHVANKGTEKDPRHGISIYFPYLRDVDKKNIERPLLDSPQGNSNGHSDSANTAEDATGHTDEKGPGGDTIGKGPGGDTIGKGPGGDTIGKGPGGDTIGKHIGIINNAATGALYAVRREIIRDTETYYRDDSFKFAKDTGWYRFIAHDWSRILAQKEPYMLDMSYSAEQCAQNLLSSVSNEHSSSFDGNQTKRDADVTQDVADRKSEKGKGPGSEHVTPLHAD